MKISSLVFLIIMLACCFNLRDLSWAQQHGSVRAPWDQLPESRGDCNFRNFTAGGNRAATKTDIVEKCGPPHHVPPMEYFFSGGHGGGGMVMPAGEKWHYYFDNETYVFTFNSHGKLTQKSFKRR